MPARLDAPLKVTGAARYALDHTFPGMVYGSVVGSTIAHGEIDAIDTTAAKSAPGVLGVYSPFDPLVLHTPTTPVFGATWVPLQNTSVDYVGQPVGFVVAETFEQARDAARLVKVTYRELPAATSLEDGLDTAEEAAPGQGDAPASITVLDEGVESIDDAFAASPVVVDATYRTAAQNHTPMEPHSAVAVWEDGTLTVYSGNQAAHMQAGELAMALGLDPDAVRAVNPFVGGAFGGKGRTSAPAFLAAAAARALGRPVKAALTREQVFTATAGRAATVQRITLGARRDGTLVALRHDSWCNTDIARSFIEPTSHGTSREWYATPNLSISQRIVPLHLPPTTFMRAPGEAPGSFALESAMDELADALGMDPIELRQRNNSIAPPGHDLQWSSKHLDECFRIGAQRFGWAGRGRRGHTDGEWLVGTGVAVAMFPALRFPASVDITLNADETADVRTSGADPGTGLLTVLSLVGAESLDIPAERITPHLGDSALPPGGMSGGSTATASTGTAIMAGASQVIDELLALASAPGGPFAGEEVTYADGRVHGAGPVDDVRRGAAGRGPAEPDRGRVVGARRGAHEALLQLVRGAVRGGPGAPADPGGARVAHARGVRRWPDHQRAGGTQPAHGRDDLGCVGGAARGFRGGGGRPDRQRRPGRVPGPGERRHPGHRRRIRGVPGHAAQRPGRAWARRDRHDGRRGGGRQRDPPRDRHQGAPHPDPDRGPAGVTASLRGTTVPRRLAVIRTPGLGTVGRARPTPRRSRCRLAPRRRGPGGSRIRPGGRQRRGGLGEVRQRIRFLHRLHHGNRRAGPHHRGQRHGLRRDGGGVARGVRPARHGDAGRDPGPALGGPDTTTVLRSHGIIVILGQITNDRLARADRAGALDEPDVQRRPDRRTSGAFTCPLGCPWGS